MEKTAESCAHDSVSNIENNGVKRRTVSLSSYSCPSLYSRILTIFEEFYFPSGFSLLGTLVLKKFFVIYIDLEGMKAHFIML